MWSFPSFSSLIFNALKKMIAIRKEIPSFADFNNRELIHVGNPHLFIFSRFNLTSSSNPVLIVGNFDAHPQYLDLQSISNKFMFHLGQIVDLYSGESPALFNDQLVIPPDQFYWLANQSRSV
mgnify:CR=1 FL=1